MLRLAAVNLDTKDRVRPFFDAVRWLSFDVFSTKCVGSEW